MKPKEQIAERKRAEDVRTMMADGATRRVLSRFLEASNVEGTTVQFNDAGAIDPHRMSHTAGWQDAGRWWLAEIRDHCPERELQMRRESREAARRATQDDDDDHEE